MRCSGGLQGALPLPDDPSISDQLKLGERAPPAADGDFATDLVLARIVEDAEDDLRSAAGKLARVRRHLSGDEDVAA